MKFLKIILKIFKKKLGKFQDLLRRIYVIFRKILILKSENFDNHFKKFREILRKFQKTSENIFGSVEILSKFLRIILKIFKKSSEHFESYCGGFRKIFHKILRNISENFKKHFKRFRVKFWKILTAE